MSDFPKDIFTEPEVDPDTLANLGPLRPLAGIWESARGEDVHPTVDGTGKDAYVERYELQPIDGQTNGPQLLYGLRYHVHVVRPGEIQTFHDQVGYWLWEPATGTVIQTLAIPRGQVAMATGTAAPGARSFELTARAGSLHSGILSIPFLDHAFRTSDFHIRVTVHDDGSWTYEEDAVLHVRGRAEPFHHTDRNTMRKVAEPTPNPTARKAAGR
jgi:hypothetical protein